MNRDELWSKISTNENYWIGFKNGISMFASVAGVLLRERDARFMAIYNRALSVYNKGMMNNKRLLKQYTEAEMDSNTAEIQQLIVSGDTYINEARILQIEMSNYSNMFAN